MSTSEKCIAILSWYVLILIMCIISSFNNQRDIKRHAEIIELIKDKTNISVYNDKAEVEFFRSLKKAGRNRNTKENVRGN